MNRAEFNRWWADYQASFPETARWFNGLPDSAVTLKLWAESLSDVDLRDCQAVTARIRLGDDEPIPAYDRENTPAIIRQRAIAQAIRRRNAEAAAKAPKSPYRDGPPVADGKFSAAKALGEIFRRTPGESIEAIIDRHLPPADDRRDWVKCKWCQDTGCVEVYDPASVKAVMETGEIQPPGRTRRFRVLACCCDGALRYPHLIERKGKSLPRFAGDRWMEGIWCPANVTEAVLLEFAASWRDREVANTPNYQPEFADFNAGGEF